MSKFIIKKLFVGRMDVALEIKTRMDNGESNQTALAALGMLENDDLQPLIFAQDENGNIIFDELGRYNEREMAIKN